MTISSNKSDKLDISNHRNLRPYSRLEYIGRTLWAITYPIFYLSPRPFFVWRTFLLRLFGAKIGKRVHIDPSARIFLPWKLVLGDDISIGYNAIIYNLGLVTIGDRATISQRAHICAGTHNYRDPSLKLLSQPISIGKQAWICADAFIGPNITIGDSAIVGAASVVVKDVPSQKIFAGNPAKFVNDRVIDKNYS